MSPEFTAKFKSLSVNALRIAAGAWYFSHGAQKLFGWFGGMGPNHGTVDLMTKFGAAGVIETVCGACIVLGILTRPMAFLASGEMAVTYFCDALGRLGQHVVVAEPRRTALPVCVHFFTYAAYGAGSFSLDAMMAKRKKA